MNKYLLIFIFLFFASCRNNEIKNNAKQYKESKPNLKMRIHEIIIDNGFSDSCKLIVEQDHRSNLIILLMNLKEQLLFDASGIGNSSLSFCDQNKGCLMKCHLDKGSRFFQYTFSTIYNGSTYGAEALFVISYNNGLWKISKANFDRYELKKMPNNYCEIIDFSNGSKGIPYTFSKGNFIQISRH